MRKVVRLFFRLLVLCLILLLAWTAIQLIRMSSRQPEVQTVVVPQVPDPVLDRLSDAIQVPTLTAETDSSAFLPFEVLDSVLQAHFAPLDSVLEKERVEQSWLYKWAGRNTKLNPVLLAAHLDVVPVDSSSLAAWEYPPFSGTIAGGFIWGRGSLDDKMSAWAMLEAIQLLVRDGYQPERTVLLAFGHDEEGGGTRGAQRIADVLANRGVECEYVLDEGSMVLTDALPGLDHPLAMISIAEKGYASYRLTARSPEGGHTAMPDQQSAIEKLATTLARLEEAPPPAEIHTILDDFFTFVGPELNFPEKLVVAARPFTDWLIVNQLTDDPPGNAMVRTTFVPTSIQGGMKENVLPQEASVILNARILPGETLESTRDFLEQTVADPQVEVSFYEASENRNPSSISSTEAFGFQVLQKTVGEIFPDAVVAPGLLVAASDGRHYHQVSEQVYRFTPIQLFREDLKRLHGVNERISAVNYKRLINFYRQLMLNSCK